MMVFRSTDPQNQVLVRRVDAEDEGWHGQPFSARDVIATLDKIQDPTTKAELQRTLFDPEFLGYGPGPEMRFNLVLRLPSGEFSAP